MRCVFPLSPQPSYEMSLHFRRSHNMRRAFPLSPQSSYEMCFSCFRRSHRMRCAFRSRFRRSHYMRCALQFRRSHRMRCAFPLLLSPLPSYEMCFSALLFHVGRSHHRFTAA
ncbi:unnamed protein product [Pylaiella littoralis]